MKLLIWIIFGLLATLWTGAAWVSAELTSWLSNAVASGQVTDVAASAGQWPVPGWMAIWIDPVWIEALKAGWAHMLGWLSGNAPALGGVVGWLVPLIWMVWGAVMLLMLLCAAAGHFLVSRLSRPAGPPRLQT